MLVGLMLPNLKTNWDFFPEKRINAGWGDHKKSKVEFFEPA